MFAPMQRARIATMLAQLGALAAASLALPFPAAADSPPPDRYEPGVLPVIGDDPDVGFKFGSFAQLVRFRDQAWPYAWRAQILAAASVRDGATGTEFPYREVYLRIDKPQAFVAPLRLAIQLGYLRTTNLGYYGLGNASSATPSWQDLTPGTDAYVRARRFYQFDGVTPVLRSYARYRLAPGWEAMVDVKAQWVQVNVFSGSLLEQDLATNPDLHLGNGLSPEAAAGLVYDTRNHETVATSGGYHDISLRCGAVVLHGDAHCGANLTLRAYRGIFGERLSLAGRLVGDLLWGQPPLIELTRYAGVEGASGPGGTRGIRGVPQGRLAGKDKLIANLELRSFFAPFSIASQRFTLGAVAFADAGRVWANSFTSSPLDGSFRIYWGAGGGPRLRWGDSLLIRADVAYAPLGAQLNAVPAIYVDVEQVM